MADGQHRRDARNPRDHRQVANRIVGQVADHDATSARFPVEQISSVAPSAGALATYAAAIVPAAPLRFSITMD